MVAAALFWNEFLKDRMTAKRFGTVEPGLIYRSGQISKWMIEPTLRRHRIQVILDLTRFDPQNEHQAAELAAARKLGIRHVRLPLSGDGTGDVGCYAEALQVLKECRETRTPVLVHCAAGADRTGGVVFCYRTLLEGVPAAEAQREMARYNWEPGEEQRLPRYLDQHMPELVELLVERGVLSRPPAQLPRLVD